MSAEEILQSSEQSALRNTQIISHVTGQKTHLKSHKKNISFSASFFLLAIILIFVFFFSSGNIIPSAINERLIEETDVQYTDAVESKKLVFQEALKSGDIPDNTANNLKSDGILIGYLENNEFKENHKSKQPSYLKYNNKLIAAENFINEINQDLKLYDAFTKATYNRAAYYYDESANKVFEELGTNRNNFTSNSDFDQTISKLLGTGSNINYNSVSLVEKTRTANNKTEVYYTYEPNGSATSSTSADFVESVRQKNSSNSNLKSTLATADALKVADTISKEQRSSLFFAVFMENISKMKAGEGNESKINEAMNFLSTSATSKIVDVKTGQLINITGTPLESPSLYAVLSKTPISADKVENFSSDRILKTVKNQLNLSSASTSLDNLAFSTIKETVASTSNKLRATISRFISSGTELATSSVIAIVTPTISKSLIENSFDSLKGIVAGEFLVEGAINLGKKLAISGSGATAGDTSTILAYQKSTSELLAKDAELERLHKSPFDLTSRHTFLGSIIYKFALIRPTSFFSHLTSLPTLSKNSLIALLPTASALETSSLLTNFGACETHATIGATGSVGCATIATFDQSTLNNTFSDPGFIQFVNNNTTLKNGVRTINSNSYLADFINFNNLRPTPLGILDGSILTALKNKSTPSFISDFANIINHFTNASESEKRIASGAAFVNSSSNPDWPIYKYAQRYVSLARAADSLRQYSNDKTSYSNIEFFEGPNNPVIAFIENDSIIANK